jgi:acid phosphatase class B
MHDSWDLFCGGTGYNHTFDDIEFTATDSNNNQYVYSLLFNKQIGDFKLDNQGFRRDLVSGYDDYIFMNKTISKALISYYKKKGIEIIKVTGDTVTYKSAKFNNFKAGPTKRVLIFDIRKKVI